MQIYEWHYEDVDAESGYQDDCSDLFSNIYFLIESVQEQKTLFTIMLYCATRDK